MGGESTGMLLTYYLFQNPIYYFKLCLTGLQDIISLNQNVQTNTLQCQSAVGLNGNIHIFLHYAHSVTMKIQ